MCKVSNTNLIQNVYALIKEKKIDHASLKWGASMPQAEVDYGRFSLGLFICLGLAFDECFPDLFDKHWIRIIKYLSYVDKIQLGGTSTRFFKLVNLSQHMNYINHLLKDIFTCTFEGFLNEFLHKFTMKFYFAYHYKCDRLYLANFIYLLKTHLNPRFVYGHLFWCQRKNILESKCGICTQVFKWEGDSDDIFLYSNKYMGFWDTRAEKLFCSDTYLSENCKLTK